MSALLSFIKRIFSPDEKKPPTEVEGFLVLKL